MTLKFPSKIEPYSGIIYFIVILLLSHFLWKFLIVGDEFSDKSITLLGLDISAPFVWMSHHVAHVVTAVLRFFGFSVEMQANNVIRHENGAGVQIIWACTGIKQAYIFFCIIAFYRGPWLKKLWYIPLGLLLVYLFNIFRIMFIVGFIKFYPNWFDFLHEGLFKYLFYFLIFGMWVYWEEKIVPKKTEVELSENKDEV